MCFLFAGEEIRASRKWLDSCIPWACIPHCTFEHSKCRHLFFFFSLFIVNNNITSFFVFLQLDLSKVVITKVAVYTSDEDMALPNEKLNARNAIFYIKYKYCPNENEAHGCKPTRDGVAIVRRNMDKISGDITLSFQGDCKYLNLT